MKKNVQIADNDMLKPLKDMPGVSNAKLDFKFEKAEKGDDRRFWDRRVLVKH